MKTQLKMFPEETASDKFVHTEQKNHWSMHEIIKKFHVTRLVNQSKILPFAWIKKFWKYIGVQHTKTIIYHQKLNKIPIVDENMISTCDMQN